MKRYFFYLLGVLLLLSACDISKPHLLSWDVDLTLPLLNERFLVSELVDSVNIVIGENDVLTITATGEASSPDFGEVNFNPDIVLEDIPLVSGANIETFVPLIDPTGSVFISFGELEEGNIAYNMNLIDPDNSHVMLILPDVTTAGGAPLTIHSNDNPNWQNFDLKDYRVGVKDSGVILDQLLVYLIIQSDQPDGTPIGTCGIRINTQIGSDYFQGYLYDYVRAIAGIYTSIDLNYPDDFEEAVQLQEAKLYLGITNEIGFGAYFYGKIHAVNSQTGQERWVDILDDTGQPFFVFPAEESGPVITELGFGHGVPEVLQIMPDSVELVDGYLLINGGHDGVPGFVKETDRFHCVYQVDMPCHFILTDHEFTMINPTEINISVDTQSQILNQVLGAALTLKVVNRIPVGASATLYIGTTDQIDPANPATYSFFKQTTLHSSQYVGPDVDANGEQTLHLELTESELAVFANPKVFVLASISLEPSIGSVIIHASPSDYIQIRGMLTAKLHVSEGLL